MVVQRFCHNAAYVLTQGFLVKNGNYPRKEGRMEGGREGGKEGRKEGGKEGRREGGRKEGGREGVTYHLIIVPPLITWTTNFQELQHILECC